MRALCLADLARRIADEAVVELAGWLRGDFLAGLGAAFRGAQRWALSGQRDAVRQASSRLRRFTMGLSIASLVVLGILWAASVILVGIVTALVTLLRYTWLSGRLQSIFEAMAFRYVLCLSAFVVPHCSLLFLRYCAYADQDRVFLSALRDEGLAATGAGRERLATLAMALEALPAESTWQRLSHYLAVAARGWFFSLSVLVLSTLHGVGPLILQGALALRRHRAIGSVLTMGLLAVSLLPSSDPLPTGSLLAAYGLQLALMAQSVSKELLYTFLGRGSKAQRAALTGRHRARVMGFGAGAGVVLSIPLAGPFLWFDLVQGAAEVFAAAALAEESEVFDLQPALDSLTAEEVRRKEDETRRALEREAHAERRKQQRETRMRQPHSASRPSERVVVEAAQ